MKRSGTVAPQNTFLDSILRRSNELDLTFVIGNAALQYYPIIYSSESFTRATDFPKTEVLHRPCSCDFLWGTLTSKETQKQIQDVINSKTTLQTEIILYKKNRQPCWFLFHISPIKNDNEDVILFLITFKDISNLKDPIADSTVTKWSRLVEKSLAKQKLDFNKTSDNARSVFLQLAKRDTNKSQKLAQIMSNTSMSIQYSWEGQKVPRFTVFHYSLFKTVWDWLVLILTLYTAVVAPFVVSFQYSSNSLVIFNLFVDTFFIVDVALNFKTTYCGKEGEIIVNSKMICMNYLKSWFAVDFVAALPYGVLNLAYGDGGWIEIINVIKVIRLVRLLRVARKLDHYLKFGAMTLVLWLFMFCLCCHWMACIWYVIAVHYDRPSTPWSWVHMLANLTNQPYLYKNGKLVDGSGPSIASAYMSALYYCMSSLTTCGFGNIAPNTTAEKLFGCVTMLLGCLLYAFIFGQVTSIIQQLQKPNSDFHQRLESIRRFTRLYTVPEEIGGRLIDYFRTTWTTNKGLDVDEILAYFPNELQADACLQIHKVVFESMPEFKTAPTPALRNVSRFFSTLRSAPGAKVLQPGEMIDCLYFVERGSMEVRKNDQIVGVLGPGDVFGSNIRRPVGKIDKSLYEIYTLTYSDLHYIKLDALTNALQLFPEFYRNFKKNLVYSFEITKKMRVYGTNGKQYALFNEEETSFIEAKSDSESLAPSHDQTMVEGQMSSDNLKRGKGNMRGSPTFASEYESKVDIFTELNILREDVKTSIEDVQSKIDAFDGKINYVLDLLHKVTFNQTEIKKQVSESIEKFSRPPPPSIDINENDTVEIVEEKPPKKKKSNTSQKVGKSKKNDKVSNEEQTAVESVSITQGPETSKNAEEKERPSLNAKKSSKGEGTSSKVNEDGASKRESSKERKPAKNKTGKDDVNSKKEDNKEKQINSKSLPETEAARKGPKSKQNKQVMKQPKQRPVVDDLDELEQELEELGIPNEGYKQQKFQSSVKKAANVRKLTSNA